ncbi:MAG: hypothetical protein FWE36_06940 [Erysipelotrichales bacterium]|nr:hypothetical protein [Erysipelotrichales bacterium]
MNKKLKIILLSNLLFLSLMALSGCGTNSIFAWHGDSKEYDHLPTIMKANEKLTIEKSHFDNFNLEFDRFELWVHSENGISNIQNGRVLPFENSSVVVIQDNIITAKDSGHVTIAASLIQSRNGSEEHHWGVFVCSFFVINESTMNHISTAEDLANINNNLSGHFILTADIDLSGSDWIPIGNATAFSGMFVNPNNYKITNFTITSSQNSRHIGLFSSLDRGALISGIILEDLYIDASDFEGDVLDSPIVGGIVGYIAPTAIVLNCFVSGTIIGGGRATGGIAGINAIGHIGDSTFVGTLMVNKNFETHSFAIGGIVGINEFGTKTNGDIIPNIINAKVMAYISGGYWANAGGIIGFVPFAGTVRNSEFSGTVAGRNAGTKTGLTRIGGQESDPFVSVNFD